MQDGRKAGELPQPLAVLRFGIIVHYQDFGRLSRLFPYRTHSLSQEIRTVVVWDDYADGISTQN
jgi:hypothetical protein